MAPTATRHRRDGGGRRPAGAPQHRAEEDPRGGTIPVAKQYSPAEIKGLSEANITPIIDPALITGESLHFADGRLFTSDASLLYVDLVRTLDEIEFMLRAGLIGLIGDARITKPGMTLLKTQVDGILGPLKRQAVIDDYTIQIPVLDILSIPEAARTATDNSIVTAARADRTVDLVDRRHVRPGGEPPAGHARRQVLSLEETRPCPSGRPASRCSTPRARETVHDQPDRLVQPVLLAQRRGAALVRGDPHRAPSTRRWP